MVKLTGIEMLKEGIIKRVSESETLTERQKKNKITKEIKIIDEIIANEKIVESINFSVTWKNYNPTLEAKIKYTNDTYQYIDGIKAGGYGYDKESTVVADLLNRVMLNVILKNIDRVIEDKKNNTLPYGISSYYIEKGYKPHFEGGVGLLCYYDILNYLGYKLQKVAGGKIFDAYTITIK